MVGLVCKDGVILATEKIRTSKLQAKSSDRRIFSVDEHIGLGICGRVPDGMIVLQKARIECENYRSNFGIPISGQILTERLANYVHAHTLYGSYRPLGCEIFVIAKDNQGHRLFKISNNGSFQGYFGCTAGKGALVAKAVFEKINLDGTMAENLPMVAYSIAKAHEEFKDKTYELEISTISVVSPTHQPMKRKERE